MPRTKRNWLIFAIIAFHLLFLIVRFLLPDLLAFPPWGVSSEELLWRRQQLSATQNEERISLALGLIHIVFVMIFLTGIHWCDTKEKKSRRYNDLIKIAGIVLLIGISLLLYDQHYYFWMTFFPGWIASLVLAALLVVNR